MNPILTQVSNLDEQRLKNVVIFLGTYNFSSYICTSNQGIASNNYCSQLAKPALKDFNCRKSPSSHRRKKKGLFIINLYKMVNQVYLSGSNFSYQMNATSDSGGSVLLLQYLLAKHHHDFLQMQLQMPKRISSMINAHFKSTSSTENLSVLTDTFKFTFRTSIAEDSMKAIYSLDKIVTNGN